MNDNKEYINTFIKRQRIISIISIVFILLSSTVSAMAVSAYLYNSNEVSYNNNASGISSTNVQGAIDELYGHVTDYTSMDTRVSALEGHFLNNPTSYFDGGWLVMKSTGTGNRGVRLYDSSNVERGRVDFVPSENITRIVANGSSGTDSAGWGKGTLKLIGNPVQINGADMIPKWQPLGGACSLNTSSYTNYTISSISPYFFVRINTSYYSAGLPDYGGVTISVAQLRSANSEGIYVYSGLENWSVVIKYVNDTTLSIKQGGTAGSNAVRCFSIHGVL